MSLDLRLFILIFFALLGSIGLVRRGLLKRAAKNWPLANATVELSYVISTGSDGYRASSWIPILGYSYVVNGERYSGTSALMSSCSNDEDAAEEAGKAWRGQRIVVRLDPQKPEKSAFLPVDGAPPGIVNYADEPPESAGSLSSLF